MFEKIEDENTLKIIRESNKDDKTILSSLKITLYSLKYKTYSLTDELSQTEISQINNYKNKTEFNNLLKFILSKSYSLKDLYLKI